MLDPVVPKRARMEVSSGMETDDAQAPVAGTKDGAEVGGSGASASEDFPPWEDVKSSEVVR